MCARRHGVGVLPIAGRAQTRNEGIKIALCPSGELAEQPDVDLRGGPINWVATMQPKLPVDIEAPPVIASLRELAKAEHECTRCPLYQNATQAVPGEGRR